MALKLPAAEAEHIRKLIEAAGLKAPARRKYRNEPTRYNGVLYDSKAEANRAAELDLLTKAGQIRGWIREPRFWLPDPETVYVPDFMVFARDGSVWVEDVKGARSRKFLNDSRRWERHGPVALHVISKHGTEIVKPNWMNGQGVA